MLTWVQDKARKLWSTLAISKSDNGRNGEKQFVTLKCERGCSYTEYKKLTKRKILASMNCDCLFRLRGYLLSVGVWIGNRPTQSWDDSSLSKS